MSNTPKQTPSTLRSRTRQVEQSHVGDERLPTVSIDLSRAQACRCWLSHLECMSASGCDAPQCLDELQDRLEDGCWLACWKREDVILDLCPTTLLSVLEVLLQYSQSDQGNEEIAMFEEMIQVLSRA